MVILQFCSNIHVSTGVRYYNTPYIHGWSSAFVARHSIERGECPHYIPSHQLENLLNICATLGYAKMRDSNIHSTSRTGVYGTVSLYASSMMISHVFWKQRFLLSTYISNSKGFISRIKAQ